MSARSLSFQQACSLTSVGVAVAATTICWRRWRHRWSSKTALLSASGHSSHGAEQSSGLTWAEVGRHNQSNDAWLVLDGHAYNVTPFLEEHPGGERLLLAFAGRDASEPFHTVGHSAIARRELKELHVGQLLLKDTIPAFAFDQEMREANLTGGRKPPSSQFCDGQELWRVEEHGFLPARDPVGVEALIDTAYEVFIDLVDKLPGLGLTGALKRELDSDLALQEKLRRCGDAEVVARLSAEQLERAFSVVGYTMLAYWRGSVPSHTVEILSEPRVETNSKASADLGVQQIAHLPEFLASPMLALSDRLGRPPMVDYAACVLYNWVRINPDGPISPSNIRCILRLTGLLDEEWLMKTLVVIESEAAVAVNAVIGAMKAEEDSELLGHLMALEEALGRIVLTCLPLMYKRADDGTPLLNEHVFYQVILPLLQSGQLVFEDGSAEPQPRNLTGPSGAISGAMSALLPCLDAALGIQTSHERSPSVLASFEVVMPLEHRRFLKQLRAQVSIRQKILLSRPPVGITSEQNETLVRAFNGCIARVLDFRWQHWSYVKHFIMRPGNISYAVGTGGASFEFLQQHITDTEKARLTDRSEEAMTRMCTPPLPRRLSTSHVYMNPLPDQNFWSVDGHQGLLARDPLSILGEPWSLEQSDDVQTALKTLCGLADRIPALCASNGPFIERCEAASQRLAALQNERFLLGLPEGARESLMSTLCHVAAACMALNKTDKAPHCIEKPLRVVARSVGRPPRLDFTELILCNWTRMPCDTDGNSHLCGDMRNADVGQATPQGEVAAGEPAPMNEAFWRQSKQTKLQIVWHFLACPDEEWYRGFHIRLHAEAREVVSSIRVGQVGMRDQNDSAITGCLLKLTLWLSKFCDYIDRFFEEKDSRTEPLMYRRLEPFIRRDSRHTLSREETACWVFCSGSSVLFPALLAFLGLQISNIVKPPRADSSADRRQLSESLVGILEEMRVFMPRMHRAFLEQLERPGVSIRQYCYRRFGGRSTSVEQLHNFEVAYNDTLGALLRFFVRRVRLVSRFFPEFATPFGILQSDIEANLRASRLKLLIMRQRVAKCLEPSGSASGPQIRAAAQPSTDLFRRPSTLM